MPKYCKNLNLSKSRLLKTSTKDNSNIFQTSLNKSKLLDSMLNTSRTEHMTNKYGSSSNIRTKDSTIFNKTDSKV